MTEQQESSGPPRMSLSTVTTGRVDQPYRITMHGLDGVGKTTFAAGAPSPIFLGPEMGTAQIDVARFPQPQAWDEVLDAVRVLGTEEHAYKTLVLDTLDWLEPLANAAVCKKENKQSVEDIPYGGGHNLAADMWRGLFSMLERLQARRGMNIILLAHSHIRPFKNPEGDDFDRYELKLNKRISGLAREWPDEVLFANYETFTHEKKGRVRGISSGARVLHTTRTAAYDAKNRHGLPDSIPLDWDAFAEACAAGVPANADAIRTAITELVELAPDDLAAKIRGAVDGAGDDAGKLARILNKAKAATETEGGK